MTSDPPIDGRSFAEYVLAEEKKHRLGSAAAVVFPMKAFFINGRGTITGLVGSPFEPHAGDEKDLMALAIRLLAFGLDAHAVFIVSESWLANRCAGCGADMSAVRDGSCTQCGASIAPPSKNPHREEVLLGTLAIEGQEDTVLWTSRFERDGDGRIIGFTDQLQGTEMPASGRFMQPWVLEDWMAPHFAINLPEALRACGRAVDERWEVVARTAKRALPSNYPLIRLDTQRLKTVVREIRSAPAADRR